MGKYLVSLFDHLLSLRSYEKNSSTKPYHVHFIKASHTPLNSVEEISQKNIDISPHLHEKGFDLMKKMGYMVDGPLGKGTGIIEPLVAQFKSNKFKIGVGYDRQEKVQPSSKAHPKHNDPSSSTLVWVPKQKGTYDPTTIDVTNVNLSLPSSHSIEEPPINTSNNEDDENSIKWEFESLSKESLHGKECVVNIPTTHNLAT